MRRYSVWMIIALAVQAGLKLWLVHRHEIAVCDYPFDDPWYVIAALNGYWNGSYVAAGFIRPPAYPLWIVASRLVGIPQRIAIELLVLIAAAALVLALRAVGVSRIAAVVVFGLVVFQPLSVYVNDSVMADAFFAPIFLLSAAGMVALLAHPASRYLMLGVGSTLALLLHTRQESPLVIMNLLLFVALLAWTRARQGRDGRSIAREVAVVGFSIGLVVFGATLTVRTLSYVRFGAFADHELALPEFRSLAAALLRILPETDACSVPVTNATLQHAFVASPTFRALQPYFDGPEGQRWAHISAQHEAGQQEIAGGALPWALLAAIRWAGQGHTADATRAFCQRAATEINAACEGGQLRCTATAWGPVVRVRNCLSRVPSSVWALGSVFWWTGAEFTPHCPATDVDPATVNMFDVALNRRQALVNETLRLSGWAIDPHDPVRNVSFRDASGRTLASTDELRARPDLDAAFKQQAATDPEAIRGAFALTISSRAGARGGTLLFTQRSGKSVNLSYEEVRTVPLRHRLKVGPDATLEYAIEERTLLQPSDLGASRALSLLFRVYGHIVVVLGAAGLLAVFRLMLRGRSTAPAPCLNGALLLLGLTALRFAVFTFVITIMWPAVDPRYLYPAVPLLPCACLMLIHCTRKAPYQPSGSTSAVEPLANP